MSQSEVTIFVCVSCRQNGDVDSRPGAGLLEALRARLAQAPQMAIKVEPVECLAVCKRPCTVALASGEKWTYVIGDLDANEHVEELVASAQSFAASETGIVPWKDRPDSFKKGVVSRTPPVGYSPPQK